MASRTMEILVSLKSRIGSAEEALAKADGWCLEVSQPNNEYGIRAVDIKTQPVGAVPSDRGSFSIPIAGSFVIETDEQVVENLKKWKSELTRKAIRSGLEVISIR